jgi:hypothetical protein
VAQNGVVTFVVGTSDGVRSVDGTLVELAGHDIVAIAGPWALARGQGSRTTTLFREATPLATVPDGEVGRCLAIAEPPAGVLVGSSSAHLYRLDPDAGQLVLVDGFDALPDRSTWYTPWGGPADVRSMAVTPSGTVLANVHVGGVARSADGGRSWAATIDIDADVHQVATAEDGTVVAAAAVGLCLSHDDGRTWAVETDGLHATYCRAVTVAGDVVVISASTGPRGSHAGLYRRPLAGPSPVRLERCVDGLPRWFDGNVDTFWLATDAGYAAPGRGTPDGAAAGASATPAPAVVCGGPDGTVYLSHDTGLSWTVVGTGLPGIRCVAVR